MRLKSLDAFRGLTVAAMLLVNNPGSWSAIYPPLEHAEWHGWTPTDLIFPFFLFIVGVTTELSPRARRARGATDRELMAHAIRRGLIIVLLGLALNAFPFYTWGKVSGVADPTLWERVRDRFEHLRFAGVLQRIGIVYLISAPLTLRSRSRTLIVSVSVILAGYWALLTLVRVPDSGLRGSEVIDQPARTLAAYYDRAVLGPNHIWRSTREWDPEGPLSTIPAIATALLGALAGRVLQRDSELRRKVTTLLRYGAAGVVAGLLWGLLFPINKNLWTSSYVLFTAGAAAMGTGLTMWLIDIRQEQRWSEPFVAFGLNPLIAFVGSGVMARITDSLVRWKSGGKSTTLHLWLYDHALASWLPPRIASLTYALLFVTLWWSILATLKRRGIVWKA